MRYHIALHQNLNLESIHHETEAGKRPGHAMWDLSQRLEATIHTPQADAVSRFDKILAKVSGSAPGQWEMARRLSSQLNHEDVIICISEAVGVPMMALCGTKQDRPRIVMIFGNANRPRVRFALKLFQAQRRVDLFVALQPLQGKFIQEYLGLPDSRMVFSTDQTDTDFFTPGASSPHKVRPLIASGGMEQRDYRTLAAATGDLDVDVKICAFSPDAKKQKRTFPEVIPTNMTHGFYDWQDLRQLYRDADIIVVPLLENKYSAGTTTMLEGMACQKPVIVSESEGIIGNLAKAGAIIGVEPEDSEELKQAIVKLLNDPQAAAVQAQRGYEAVLGHYSKTLFVENIVAAVKHLQ